MNFQLRLKQLREEKKMSQLELSKLLKLSNVTLSQYENGVRKPDLETLERIADYFKINVDYLLGRTNIKDVDFEPPKLIAAHTEHELNDEELKEVNKFIDYLLSKRD